MPKASESDFVQLTRRNRADRQSSKPRARATRTRSIPYLQLPVSGFNHSTWSQLNVSGKKDRGVPKFQAAKGTGKQAMPYGKSKVRPLLSLRHLG
jgi:hypothetical protein